MVLSPSSGPIRILDIGAGLGQMSIWLAAQGHHVQAIEPSSDMLKIAHRNIAEAKLTEKIDLKQQLLQQLSPNSAGKFDLIIFHAVLEWLALPNQSIKLIKLLLNPGGFLSVMFYNKNSSKMRSLVVGDFDRINNGKLAGDGAQRLAPISLFDSNEVREWLLENELKVNRHTGIRCFYDYMLPEVRKRADIEEVLKMELDLSLKQAWIPLARYQHIICQNTFDSES